MTELAFRLASTDNVRLANLCGQFDEHLKQIEQRLSVQIGHRGDQFEISGADDAVANANKLITHLYAATETETLTPERVHLYLQDSGLEHIYGCCKP